MTIVHYEAAGPILAAFHASDAFARVLIGPFASGKTTATIVEIFRRAMQQAPGPDGTRRTRWAAIRSTFPELRTTTVPSWRSWFGDKFGPFNWTPPYQHTLRFPLEDGTRLECEVLFLALDGPGAADKLRGLELTGGWVNEAKEVPKAVVDTLLARVGRYPALRDGGCTWAGVLLDSNPPDSDHWLYRLAEEKTPPNWAIFRQPGGLIREGSRWVANPAAENLQHLRPDYYTAALAGQSDAWIACYLGGEYSFITDGRPVFSEFADAVHVAAEPLAPIRGVPLVIGLDFGLTPAAAFCQRASDGRWLILGELVSSDMGVATFARELAAIVSSWFPGMEVQCWGDPAGDARAQSDETTCFEMIREHAGIAARPAPTNDFVIRREAVAGALTRMIDGKPGLIVSPAARMIRKGFLGGYAFKRVQVLGDERYRDVPDKNLYSHVADALQYALCGGGEARRILGRQRRHRPVQVVSAYDELFYA